jgi:hypothetical protein
MELVVKFKIERLGGTHSMQNVTEACANCSTDTKCRRREFSEQAWSVLVLWNEITPTVVDQPICDHCYDELREVLIDRADEIEAAVTEQPAAPAAKPAAAATAKKAQGAAPRGKVRKAG